MDPASTAELASVHKLVKVKALMFVTAKVGSTVTDARGFQAQITTAMIYLHSQSQLLYQPFLMAFKGRIHYQHHSLHFWSYLH
jgi:hypothetical protein